MQVPVIPYGHRGACKGGDDFTLPVAATTLTAKKLDRVDRIED